jgi:hypothetical protein
VRADFEVTFLPTTSSPMASLCCIPNLSCCSSPSAQCCCCFRRQVLSTLMLRSCSEDFCAAREVLMRCIKLPQRHHRRTLSCHYTGLPLECMYQQGTKGRCYIESGLHVSNLVSVARCKEPLQSTRRRSLEPRHQEHHSRARAACNMKRKHIRHLTKQGRIVAKPPKRTFAYCRLRGSSIPIMRVSLGIACELHHTWGDARVETCFPYQLIWIWHRVSGACDINVPNVDVIPQYIDCYR